jgi:uncharacterized protein (DUF1778 family)
MATVATQAAYTNHLTKKEQRISLRVSPEVKREIETAAGLSNMSLSDFMLSVSQHKAKQVIHDAETITLDNASRDAFLDLLDNPPKPNQALKDLVKQNEHQLYL